MPIYDVLIADELLPEFTNDNLRMPERFHIIEATGGPVADPRQKRFRVQDDNAPAWTDGKLISPVFRSEYGDDGKVTRVTVIEWHEEHADLLRYRSAEVAT